MRILLICNKSPWPPKEGGPLAMYAIISGLLKAGHHVKVLAANTNKYFVDPSSIPDEFRDQCGIEFADVDLSVKPFAALENYLKGYSYHVARFHNRAFEQKLASILKAEEFDIIQTEMIYTTVYLDTIRKYSNAKVILRAHNIEHLIWKRIAGQPHNPLKKHYINHLFRTLKEYEIGILNKVDGIAAITETDAGFFREHAGQVPVISVPYGIEPELLSQEYKATDNVDLFHIGSMNWIPNQEGIKWFLDQVWPEVRKRFPSLQLHLAGRMMPGWLVSCSLPGVIIDGEVPDAVDFIKQHAVMVVPLFSGSGIRIKIIEAMSAGKPVIATAIGAEGIHYNNGEDIMIADTSEQFVKAVELLMNDAGRRDSIGRNARRLVETNYNNKILIDNLISFYKDLIDSDKGAS